MATITNKVVTVPLLKVFKDESDKVYVGNEALTTKLNNYVQNSELTEQLSSYAQTSSLSDYLKKTEIDTELTDYVKSESLTTTLGDYLKKDEIDTTLTDYAKTSDLASTYATKSELTNLGTILGECEFADLEDKKEGATLGDCYVVTDKSNHLYYYNNTDWIDTQTVVDLTPYLKKTEAESTYAKQATVTSGLAGKADKTELEQYVKAESLQEATEEDIKALFVSEAA